MRFCPYYPHFVSDLDKLRLSNCEFRENRCSESHILLKSVNEIIPCFLHFASDLDRLCKGAVYKSSISDDVSENCFSGNCSLLKLVNELSTFIVRFGWSLYMLSHLMPSSACEFPENRLREGRTFLMELYLRVNHAQVCMLPRAVYHLHSYSHSSTEFPLMCTVLFCTFKCNFLLSHPRYTYVYKEPVS